MHAFTGCDTVSAFAGRGKIGALKQMKCDESKQEVFSELGKSWDTSNDLLMKTERLTCQLYVPTTQISEVNTLRYKMFCAKRAQVESSQLPPCQDCLYRHISRANYQAAVWRRCLENDPSEPNPVDHGWTTTNDGKLSIDWMHGPPAPEAVLELLSCVCVRSCKLPDCLCLSNGLKCTTMCKLQTCTNQQTEEESITELTDSESDGEDDE